MNAKEKRKRKELITTILLAVFGLVVAAAAYYFFVYNTVEAEINSIRAERAQVEDSMLSIETQVAQMRRMRAEIQAMNLESVSRMPSYNNSAAELAVLNYILSATDDYSVSFRQILRDGNQVRRSFNFSFTTDSFPSAMDAIQKLQENPFRCLLGNLTFIESSNRDGGASIQVSGEATFYETLVGGQADGGLPPDKAGN